MVMEPVVIQMVMEHDKGGTWACAMRRETCLLLQQHKLQQRAPLLQRDKLAQHIECFDSHLLL
jgi:hypothetical protein